MNMKDNVATSKKVPSKVSNVPAIILIKGLPGFSYLTLSCTKSHPIHN